MTGNIGYEDERKSDRDWKVFSEYWTVIKMFPEK